MKTRSKTIAVLVIALAAALSVLGSTAFAAETIPLFNWQNDLYTSYDSQTDTYTVETTVNGVMPKIESIDRESSLSKATYSDDSIRFSYQILANHKRDTDWMFYLSFRDASSAGRPWDARNAFYVLIYADKVRLQINQGSATNSYARDIAFESVLDENFQVTDTGVHTIDIAIDDELREVRVTRDKGLESEGTAVLSADESRCEGVFPADYEGRENEVGDYWVNEGCYSFSVHCADFKVIGLSFENSKTDEVDDETGGETTPPEDSSDPAEDSSEGNVRPPRPDQGTEDEGGCGGSAAAGSLLAAAVGLTSAVLLSRKGRREGRKG